MTMLAATVKTRATTLDVYVNGKRVGCVSDCGDCWRASLYDRRRRRVLMNVEYGSRSEAVRGVVNAAG
jgi:hypothetical protein